MALYEDILCRLSAGEKVEDIAAYLTKTINDANKEYTARMEEARRKDEEEKRKAVAAQADKMAAVEAFLLACEDIVKAWNLGDDIWEFLDEVDAEKVVQEIDEMVAFMGTCNKALRPARPVTNKQPEVPKSSNPLDEFLNKYVR